MFSYNFTRMFFFSHLYGSFSSLELGLEPPTDKGPPGELLGGPFPPGDPPPPFLGFELEEFDDEFPGGVGGRLMLDGGPRLGCGCDPIAFASIWTCSDNCCTCKPNAVF